MSRIIITWCVLCRRFWLVFVFFFFLNIRRFDEKSKNTVCKKRIIGRHPFIMQSKIILLFVCACNALMLEQGGGTHRSRGCHDSSRSRSYNVRKNSSEVWLSLFFFFSNTIFFPRSSKREHRQVHKDAFLFVLQMQC